MRLTRGLIVRPAPVPTMPPGLVELMEGLTRDVLHHNPADLHQFCANHIEKLLVIRDGRAPNNKQRLTLEQKIKRAQEKVREKAEQRRRKYDEEMMKYYQEIHKAGTGSEGNNEQGSSSNQEDKPPIEEKHASGDSVIESRLKAPVHHEQDLTDALEVEIFHKLVEEQRNLNTLQTKDDNEMLTSQIEQNQIAKKGIKNNVIANSNTSDSEEKQVITLNEGETNTNAMLEREVVHESNVESPHDHVRTPRSDLSVEDNEGEEKCADENIETDVFETENPGTSITKELTGELQSALSETVDISTAVTDNEQDVDDKQGNVLAEVPTDNTNNKPKNDAIQNTEYEIDSATVFANEVPALSEKNIAYSDNLPALIDNNDSHTLEEKMLDTKRNEEGIEVKDSFNKVSKVEEIDNIVKTDTPKEIEATELTSEDRENNDGSKGEITAIETREVQSNSSESNSEQNGSSLEHSGVYNSDKVDQKDKDNEHELRIDKVTEIINKQELKEYTANRVNETELDVNIHDHTLNKKEILNDSETTGNSEIDKKKENGLNTDEKIIEAIQQLHVLNEPVVLNEDDKKDQEVNNHLSPENNENNSQIKHLAETEFPSEQIVIDRESGKESNIDSTIITVNNVLVEENGDIRDDNDSAREQQINNYSENNMQTIGRQLVQENGVKSPQSELVFSEDFISNQDILKEKIEPEHILAEDDMTTTSEPIKPDLETSSLGKSSSMDDSFIITEIDELKTGTESTQNKEIPSGMDLETAAITIQKVFRTFLFKSRSSFDGTGIEEGNSIDDDSEKTKVEFPVTNSPLNKERRTLGISRMDTVLQTVNEEKSLSLSTDDSSLSSAATIIQAHVRGFLTRNRLNSNKTNSSSLVNSDGPSSTSLDNDLDQKANKTVLNIHIVPEGEHFMSRDESLLTSMELSLDGSPPSSTNLHPLGYDKSEPRKQLKREDAIQSISPPSNNSGKLSEDSVKEVLINTDTDHKVVENLTNKTGQDADTDSRDDTPTKSTTIETVIEAHKFTKENSNSSELDKDNIETAVRRKRSLLKDSSDESDVVTPFEEKSSTDSDATSGLLHSGEFHDLVLPTKVSRGDTSVVRGE